MKWLERALPVMDAPTKALVLLVPSTLRKPSLKLKRKHSN
jgi:hypothetical protein